MREPDGVSSREYPVNIGFEEIELVAYVADLKVVGVAHIGVGQRASSRRSSDFIRAFADERLTLSRVRIYDKSSTELLDTSPFVILNLSKVDLIYAREDVTESGEAEPPRKAPPKKSS
jgi:hypothetical protein